MEHDRCYTVWATQTRKLHVVNQLMWFPKLPFPRLNNINPLRATIEDAIVLLRNPPQEMFAGTLEDTNQAHIIRFFNTINQHDMHKSDKDNQSATPPLGVAAPNPRCSTRLNQNTSASAIEPAYQTQPSAGIDPQPLTKTLPKGELASTAINPDTGKAAEYCELVRSTAGP